MGSWGRPSGRWGCRTGSVGALEHSHRERIFFALLDKVAAYDSDLALALEEAAVAVMCEVEDRALRTGCRRSD